MESSSLASSEPPITCRQGRAGTELVLRRLLPSHEQSFRIQSHCSACIAPCLTLSERAGRHAVCDGLVPILGPALTSTRHYTCLMMAKAAAVEPSASLDPLVRWCQGSWLSFAAFIHLQRERPCDSYSVLEPSKPPATKTLLSSNDATAQPLRPTPRSNSQHAPESPRSLEHAELGEPPIVGPMEKVMLAVSRI